LSYFKRQLWPEVFPPVPVTTLHLVVPELASFHPLGLQRKIVLEGASDGHGSFFKARVSRSQQLQGPLSGLDSLILTGSIHKKNYKIQT